MKTKKQITNRILSLVLALVLVLGMVPMTAFAAENYVASVTTTNGTENYTDITTAISTAAENPDSTLKLLDNISTDRFSITKGRFTIDLNSKTWETSYYVMINGSANIKITDNSAEGKGKLLGVSNKTYTISLSGNDGARLEIAGGTVENNSSFYAISMSDGGLPTNTHLIVSGGNLITKGNIAISARGTSVTVTGGTIEKDISYGTGTIDLSKHGNPTGIKIAIPSDMADL